MWWFSFKMHLKDMMFTSQNKIDLVNDGNKGQVPCFHIKNQEGSEQYMYESADIIRYLSTKKN